MRVAFNLEQLLHPPPGGVGRYTAELARLLPALPADDEGEIVELAPFVARHRPERVTAALAEFGLEALDPVVLGLPRPLLYDAWHVLGIPGLAELERHGPIDVVHAPSVAVPPAGGRPLVVTVHDAAPLVFPETYPRRGRWFHRRGIAATARRADLVITVSQAAAAELDEYTGIPADRVRVVPNGADLRPASDDQVRSARDAFGIGDAPYVLWLGSLEPRKNVGVLFEAYRHLVRGTDLPHLLVLAGPSGWLDAPDSARNATRELAGRVRMIGRVGDDHLRAVYRGADLFAFPSLHEGFGIPVLEAMAQGTPVVCSDIPALREVSGGAARLVPPRDVDAWASALAALLGGGTERARLAAAGRERASAFSWERCARETRAVYREAIGDLPAAVDPLL